MVKKLLLWATPVLAKNPDSIPFAPAKNYHTGRSPVSVFCADLDGNGSKDIAVANSAWDWDSVSIWINKSPSRCGNVNGDATVDVSDVIYLINYLFKGGPAPQCPPSPYLACADVNADGKVTISDVVYLVNYLFKGGPQPCS